MSSPLLKRGKWNKSWENRSRRSMSRKLIVVKSYWAKRKLQSTWLKSKSKGKKLRSKPEKNQQVLKRRLPRPKPKKKC